MFIVHVTIYCSELFVPPIRMTACGHVFCERCLIQVANRESYWHCPESRQVHRCTVESLPRNYRLERLVEKFQNQPQSEPQPEPETCDTHDRIIEIREFVYIHLH